MLKNNKLLTVSLIVVFVLSSIGAVAVGEDDVVLERGLPEITSSGEVNIMTGWTAGAAWEAMQKVRDELVPNHYPDVSVTLEGMNTSKIKTTATSRLASGNPPLGATVPAGATVKNWAREGALVDFTPLWEEYDLQEIIPDKAAKTVMLDGKYYAMPVGFEQHGYFWWNNNVFNEVGVEAPPYETWEDFFEAGEEFNEKSDLPFFVTGLQPGTDALDNALYFAAKRYGVDIYERVYNGTSTREDWEKALKFYERILGVANSDYASLFDIFDNQVRVADGKGGATWQGFWAWNVFNKRDMEVGKDFGRGHLPGPPIYKFNVGSFVAFKGSGKEDIGKALAALFATKVTQTTVSTKGTVPARQDIAVDADTFPDVSVASSKYLEGDPALVPTAAPNMALPSGAYSNYPQPIVEFLTGSSSLDNTVNKLLDLQEKYKDKLQETEWEF